MTKKLTLTILTTLLICNYWGKPAEVQAQELSPGYALILLVSEQSTPEKLAEINAVVKAGGGRVIHTFPYQAVIANLPPAAINQVENTPGVAGVFSQAVDLSLMDIYGFEARRIAAVWNNLIAPPSAQLAAEVLAEHPEEYPDAFTPPDLPPDDTGLAHNTSITPGYYQTSEFLAGSVAVGIILVESNGAVDVSTEDWTPDEKEQVFSEIVGALNWWATLEPRANLSFVYDDHFTNPLPTKVEPISRPYLHQQYWIGDAMAALRYTASSYFTAVRDYNNALRQSYQTDWAFTIFVVDSSADSDNRFSDGYFAYAYLGGPFTVMTSGNNGYGAANMDAVLAHEMGHIFLALDQYYNAGQGCTYRSGYLSVENQNSQYGTCASNVTSIMRGQTYPYYARAIDSYAAGQLGWRDSDGDNILDPLDVDLPVSLDTLTQTGNDITVFGSAQITPYPSPSRASVTINTLTGVRYRLDGQEWQLASATDGSFDGVTETYEFAIDDLATGVHTLEVAALDSAGNSSADYAAETVTILDPVDGGLNTELFLPDNDLQSSQASSVNGVAYHLQNGTIARVEYRLNNGLWQLATAQDGSFDSDYEPFTLAIDSLEPGNYLIEAFATDADGNQEVNMASEEIKVTGGSATLVFLPVITR